MNSLEDLDKLLESIQDSSKLQILIERACVQVSCQSADTYCDKDSKEHFVIHLNCFKQEPENLLPIPKCLKSFLYAVIKTISSQPKIFTDECRDCMVKNLMVNDVKVRGLISLKILHTLYKSDHQLMTWLKYEYILIALIKERLYETKSIASEILEVVKNDLEPEISRKFSPIMKSCAKHCRESNKDNIDEEEKEKWCEIIDWMSWFVVAAEDDID